MASRRVRMTLLFIGGFVLLSLVRVITGADQIHSSGTLRAALAEPDVFVRIGRENEIPAMRSLAMVASGYGVAQRKLGIVSVIGPVRMDYATAIPTVREIAHELSRFVEDAYAER